MRNTVANLSPAQQGLIGWLAHKPWGKRPRRPVTWKSCRDRGLVEQIGRPGEKSLRLTAEGVALAGELDALHAPGPTPAGTLHYDPAAVAAILRAAVGNGRRPTRLTTQARRAIDALTDVLGNDGIDQGDRVAFETARAALESYTHKATS